MHADLFYETGGNAAIPLYLLSQSQWLDGGDLVNPIERNCLAARQFQGKLGSMV